MFFLQLVVWRESRCAGGRGRAAITIALRPGAACCLVLLLVVVSVAVAVAAAVAVVVAIVLLPSLWLLVLSFLSVVCFVWCVVFRSS